MKPTRRSVIKETVAVEIVVGVFDGRLLLFRQYLAMRYISSD